MPSPNAQNERFWNVRFWFKRRERAMISFGSWPSTESSAIKTSVFGDLSAHLGRPSKTALMILRAVSQYSGQARGTFSDPAASPLAMFSKP
jgi:hypothetical protein